jgi:hypothetical protein
MGFWFVNEQGKVICSFELLNDTPISSVKCIGEHIAFIKSNLKNQSLDACNNQFLSSFDTFFDSDDPFDYYCSFSESLNISNYSESYSTLFHNCHLLTEEDVPGWDRFIHVGSPDPRGIKKRK